MYVTSVIEVVLAWFLVDLLTGLYHFATDKGYNFKYQVDLFNDHHQTNTMAGFDWQPMVVGTPALLLGVWIESSFIVALGSFAILAQVPHYYAHVTNPPRYIIFLQKIGLMISPEHHAAHHDGTYNRNFCIFTGWCDYLLNPFLWLLRI